MYKTLIKPLIHMYLGAGGWQVDYYNSRSALAIRASGRQTIVFRLPNALEVLMAKLGI